MSDSTPESSDDVEVEPVQFNPADLVDMEAEEAVHTLIRQAVDLSASDLFLLTDQRSVCLSVRRLGIVERIAVVPLIQDGKDSGLGKRIGMYPSYYQQV